MVVKLHEGRIDELELGQGPFYGPGATVLGIVNRNRVWDIVDVGYVNCKTGSSRLLNVEMLRASQDSLLYRTCVVRERDKERKADEPAVRNIANEVTNKTIKSELQKIIKNIFVTSKKNTQEILTVS